MAASLQVDAELGNLAVIRRFMRAATASLELAPAFIDGLEAAVDELATNIILHGYDGQPGDIEIEVEGGSEAVVIRLRDHAAAYDPTKHADPDLTLPFGQRPVGGLGIYLARQNVDAMTYRRIDADTNELTLTKILSHPSSLAYPSHARPHEHDE